MNRKLTTLILLALLPLAGCDKIKGLLHRAKPTPTPAPSATPAPGAPAGAAATTPAPKVAAAAATAAATPETEEANKDAQVIVLCYHRFEGKNLGYLSIPVETFEEEMKALKDNGISVISMQDLLAWKRGEKIIPAKSAVITIDDGYESGYSVAWPILKRYGYPFTMFIYTKFVSSGGKSISWSQLEEMRDAGVDIQSHTATHPDLRKKAGKSPEAYDAWLTGELQGSKEMMESRLGIKVTALAFPYGGNNEHIRAIGKAAGYEAMFTVYGQRIGWSADNSMLGRYAVEFAKPQIFASALSWNGAIESGPATLAAEAMKPPANVATTPKDGDTVTDPMTVIAVDLTSYGAVDPATVTMRVSGFGAVAAKFDPATKKLSYTPEPKLRDKSYTVIVSGKAKTKFELRWTFNFDPNAAAPKP